MLELTHLEYLEQITAQLPLLATLLACGKRGCDVSFVLGLVANLLLLFSYRWDAQHTVVRIDLGELQA